MPESSTGAEDLNNHAGEEEILPGAGNEGQSDDKGANATESPAAESKDDNKPKEMVDAVRAALSQGKEQSSGSDEGEEGAEGAAAEEPGEEPGESEEDPEELTAEEVKGLKPKTRRRFEKFRDQVKDLTGQLEKSRPAAEGFESILNYAKQSNLSREDVNTGFNIMRLMRNDPVAAFEALKPIYADLSALVGEVLPKDLREQVNVGQITLEAAKELSRRRATEAVRTNISTETAQRTKQQNDEAAKEANAKFSNDVASAISTVESEWKAKDLDFPAKQRRITEAIELELNRELRKQQAGQANNLPRTVEEAVKFAKDIKKRVDVEMRAFIPKRNKEITHVSGNGRNNESKPKAGNMEDVVRGALNR